MTNKRKIICSFDRYGSGIFLVVVVEFADGAATVVLKYLLYFVLTILSFFHQVYLNEKYLLLNLFK